MFDYLVGVLKGISNGENMVLRVAAGAVDSFPVFQT